MTESGEFINLCFSLAIPPGKRHVIRDSCSFGSPKILFLQAYMKEVYEDFKHV